MAAVRHLGFVMCVFGAPTKGICDLYHCAKSGWNRCSSFDNMQFLLFRELGLETPVYAVTPQNWRFGGFDPINGELSHRDPQNAVTVAETRHMSH